MVGGTVIEVVDLATKVYINCADKPRGRKKADECAIYVKHTPESEKIQIGDAIWWQGGNAYWTPKDNRLSDEVANARGLSGGVDYDIPIQRIGYSGVSNPFRENRNG